MKDKVLSGAVAIAFIVLSAGLFYTQVIRYGYYSNLSRNNSIRIIPIDGPRGQILDRNGAVLASNRISFDVTVIYREIRDRLRFLKTLKDKLGLSGRQIASSLSKAMASPYSRVVVAEDIDKDRAISLEEEIFDLRGLVVETRSRRDYRYGPSGSHILGYLGEISESELERLEQYGYRAGDLIGRSGIEKYYDSYLKGVDGGIQIEVDSVGRQKRVLGLREPAQGTEIQLTVDAGLQAVCDKALGDDRGAAIVMDPRTGEILALASHPAFDPNIFVKATASAERLDLLSDNSGRPLSDKAISATYPPGSVFKIVTASAALESKKISPYTSFVCSGSYHLGRASFDCWKEGGHGSQNIVRAIMNSCNVFFYNIGRIAGVDAIEHYAKLYGYGRVTGIDLPDEVKGTLPGKAWKRTNRKGAWYEGETLNYAIGQGYLSVTPIQVLTMTAVIANNGFIVRPHVVKRVGDTVMGQPRPKFAGLKASTIDVIRQGLFEVVNNENGTGRRAKAEGVVAAGKTGTAQNPQGRTHAWFTGYAPYKDAKICLVVFIEHGGKGGVAPAGIAGEIFAESQKAGYL
jgi:penicillin-binding protein 2